jgi:hypothetical protein
LGRVANHLIVSEIRMSFQMISVKGAAAHDQLAQCGGGKIRKMLIAL